MKKRFKSTKKQAAISGFSLTEMLITMAIVGLVTTLMMPKILSSSAEQTNQLLLNRGNIATQQISLAIEAYKQRNDLDNTELLNILNATNPSASYDSIFFFNGNYFSYKAEGVGNSLHYFYFTDQSRMSFDPNYFVQGDYTAASIPAAVATACVTGDVDNPSKCVFIDTNGARSPNSIGKEGDIIPLLIDTNNFTLQTVYQSIATGTAGRCNTVSAYDVAANVTGATACP